VPGDDTNVQSRNSDARELNLPQGVPPLTSLYLYIAGTCNLACLHCWITPGFSPDGNGGQFLKLEYVEKAIREAIPLGLNSVKLTGGEPALHPRFREIVSSASKANLRINIETNGTLINEDLANFLSIKSVSFVSVSIDGSTAKVHDGLRMVEGSHRQALEGIKALVKAGFSPQLICTLHQGNAFQLLEVVNLAESLGCGSVKFNHVQRIGRGERFAIENGLEITEIVQLYQRVEDELQPKSRIPIFFAVPIAFFPIQKLLDDSLNRCNVKNILGLLASGELSMCGIGVNVPELIYGHIETDNLREVWIRHPGLIKLREQVPAQFEGICAQCLHRKICLGYCIAQNYHTSGKLTAPFNFCENAAELGLFPHSRLFKN